MSQRSIASSKFLSSLGRTALVLAALAPIAYSTYKDWPAVQAALANISWLELAVALALLTFATPLMGLIPWLTLRHLGANQSLVKAMGLYFISQLAKYLPGGIWAYPGRMVAYQTAGIGRTQAIISVSREVVALFLGAAAMALVGLFTGLPLPLWMQAAAGFGVACCIAAIFFLQMPRVWQWLARIPFLRPSALTALQDGQITFSLRWLPDTFIVSLVFWLAAGAAFRWLVLAVNPQAILTWLQATSIFALAWCVGFVIVFLPAGFGARESSLTLLLAGVLSPGEAVSVALLARLWWMAAEAVFIMAALIVMPHAARKDSSSSQSA